VQINPIWVFGPFNAAEVSAASQPDWYMGWLDGALRIMPGWEIRAFGFEIPNPFFPGVLLATVTFVLLYLWPFLEARVTGDYAEHHIDDRPRQRPVRTALGAATLSFYSVLFLGAASDVIASSFQVSVNAVLWTFRVAVFVLPPLVAVTMYRLCKELSARDGLPVETQVKPRDIPARLFRRRAHEPDEHEREPVG
jgi:ubiquinol-cytochrome c reductase cytochrome b subunit